MKVFRERIETSYTLLLVAETCSYRLRDIQHVGDIVPAVRIVLRGDVFVNVAGSIFFEKTNQRVATRSTIEPEGEWIICWIVPTLKEPVEYVNLDDVQW